ncbi:MAG: insulinase family protein [Melioribacteraceae bacterium]|nr:insulinase family protein [Melioribacteraceae bacterium]MCF8355666.1 insulinase family protein [Melioribacteraceae bacterium]MCF8395132.1 insulinase family protein [Melioribacteraceae bacterium]MCF8420574.1 insulinase family protein [Melioribacteraceae bacterium]
MNDILNINYYKETLDNGLDVILYDDKSIPLTAVNLWYKVGSANEKPGKTGFAHLFEHMMFQGSENVSKEMHFRYIQEAGGSLNGSTSFDRTNYYETLPSNFLELALWLESDRMGLLLPALTQEKLTNQKEVVMNERRQRYENQPYGMAWELLFSNLFNDKHPYHWPTIGWMKDIENFQLEDVRNFFKTYYLPNNTSLIIGGDFEHEQALDLVKKYFGDFKSNSDIPKINFEQEQLDEVIRIDHEDDVQLPRLYLAWHSDKLYGKDDAVLDVLSEILSGSKNTRLYRTLVYEKQIAQDVSCFQYSANLQGMFIIIATAKPGVELHTIREEIFSEIEKIVEANIEDREIQKARNSVKSSYIYSLQNLSTLVDHMNNYNCNLNEPNSFIFDLNRYEQIKKIHIINSIEKYLDKPFVELHIIPKKK